MDTATTVVVDGLAFPEGPRWHDGRLFFSDMHQRVVLATTTGGEVERVVEVPGSPSGLGWLPDGRMLIVSMEDRRLLRRDADGALTAVADLSGVATFHCNDMVVDAVGRAYVGNFGFDLHGHAEPRPASMALVDVDGSVQVAAADLRFPNGTVITPDERTLVVGESFAGRLTAFDIGDDGALSNRRVWARLEGAVPDGICLDAEGAIWVASPTSREVLRVAEGGEVLARVPTGDRGAFACMLGGDDRRTLFVCTSATMDPAEAAARRTGRIEAVTVDVPGAGRP